MEWKLKGIAICILALISSGHLAASNATDTRGGDASSTVEVGRSLPAGVELRPIFRIYRDKTATHNTNYYWPNNWEDIGWKLEGGLGSVSSTQFENSIHLRSCVGPHSWNYFTSSDPNCEAGIGGVIIPGNWDIGYVSAVELPGTAPLYRCSFWWDKKMRHFDTLRADCEGWGGAFLDGVLGYVFM